MIIIPAIDLKNGKCVRLEQGKMEQETIFSQDPPAVARKWEALGAENCFTWLIWTELLPECR